MPDAKYVEVAAAFLELKPGAAVTEDEIIAFCTGAMARFKVPRYVRVGHRVADVHDEGAEVPPPRPTRRRTGAVGRERTAVSERVFE